LLVRTLDEITDTEADIKTENWRSKRIMLAKDGLASRCTRPRCTPAR